MTPGYTTRSTPGASAPVLGEVLGSHQDLPRLGPLPGPDDAVLLHHVDEAGRLRIPEAQPTLKEGDGGGFLADHQIHGVPVDVVTILSAAIGAVGVQGGHLHLLVD